MSSEKRRKVLFILFVILGSFMFCDAVLMFNNNEFREAIKDIVFGIAYGSIGFVYLLSTKDN